MFKSIIIYLKVSLYYITWIDESTNTIFLEPMLSRGYQRNNHKSGILSIAYRYMNRDFIDSVPLREHRISKERQQKKFK